MRVEGEGEGEGEGVDEGGGWGEGVGVGESARVRMRLPHLALTDEVITAPHEAGVRLLTHAYLRQHTCRRSDKPRPELLTRRRAHRSGSIQWRRIGGFSAAG